VADVFISYASEDKEAAAALKAQNLESESAGTLGHACMTITNRVGVESSIGPAGSQSPLGIRNVPLSLSFIERRLMWL
jgi:hypothetical protein